ncbi:MAG: hypothetical protein ACP5HD_06325 [Thermoproteus sp.]
MEGVAELARRVEAALGPQPTPTLGEVLAEIGRRGVAAGSVGRVFEGYRLYVHHVAGRLAELSPQYGRQIGEAADGVIGVLEQGKLEAESVLRIVARLLEEGRGVDDFMYIQNYEGHAVYTIKISGVRASIYFPNILDMDPHDLISFSIGWRASDETREGSMAAMGTTQIWQVFAWLAARPGGAEVEIRGANLTKRGISPIFFVKSTTWRQRMGKWEAIKLAVEAFNRGDYRPLLTWWLGDGSVKWSFVRRRHYKLRIAVAGNLKQELSRMFPSYSETGENYIYVTGGKELFLKIIQSAGRYGELLDVLSPHKWLYLKSAEAPRRRRKRPDYAGGRSVAKYIDIAPGEGLIMGLRVVFNEGGSLWATKYFPDAASARDFSEKLRKHGLEPKIAKTKGYTVYISTRDLKKLVAQRDDIKIAVFEFLNGKLVCAATERQKRIIEKLIMRLKFY